MTQPKLASNPVWVHYLHEVSRMRFFLVLGAVVLISGCGDDGSTVEQPPTPDASSDRGTGGSGGMGGNRPDGSTPEADAPVESEASKDAPSEADAFVGPEADVVGDSDASEGGKPDAPGCTGGTIDCAGNGTCVDVTSHP